MASPVFDNRLNKMLEINVYHKLMIVNLLSRSDNYINYGNYMELKLLNKLDDDQLDLEFLQDNGLKGNVQGPMTLKGTFKKLYTKVLKTNILNLDNELENTEYVEGKPYAVRY